MSYFSLPFKRTHLAIGLAMIVMVGCNPEATNTASDSSNNATNESNNSSGGSSDTSGGSNDSSGGSTDTSGGSNNTNQPPTLVFNVTSNGGHPNFHQAAPLSWSRAAELTVYSTSDDGATEIGSATVQLNENTSNGSQTVALNDGVTLTTGQDIRFSLTHNRTDSAELSCFPADPDAFSSTDYRFARTLVAGTNTLNVQCDFPLPLRLEVTGLPADETVSLRFSKARKLDLDDFNATLNVVHNVTGTGSTMSQQRYWRVENDGTTISLTDSLFHPINNTFGGFPFAQGNVSVTVEDTSANVSCSVNSPYDLSASGDPLQVTCQQTAYIPQQRLKPFEIVPHMGVITGAKLGYTLAASNNILAVGSDTNFVDLATNPPLYVYIFNENITPPRYEPFSLVRSARPTENNYSFAQSVDVDATDGVYLVVGASGFSGNVTTPVVPLGGGAAFVYTYRDPQFDALTVLTAPLPQASANFGQDVALSERAAWLAVGAPRDATDFVGIGMLAAEPTVNSGQTTGAVYMYQGGSITGSGLREAWTLNTVIKPTSNFQNAEFGHALDIDATSRYLLVGMPNDSSSKTGVLPPEVTTTVLSESIGENQPSTYSGAAVLFSRDNNGNWIERAYLKHSTATENLYYGKKVQVILHDNILTVAVAAPGQHRVWVYRTTENEGANGATLFPSAPMVIDTPHTNLSLKDIALSSDGQRIAVSYTESGSINTPVEYRHGYVATYDFFVDGQAWALSDSLTALLPELTGDSQDDRSPYNNPGAFGSAVVFTDNSGRIAVGANSESCGFDSTASVNPVNCGVWSAQNSSGSVYIYD